MNWSKLMSMTEVEERYGRDKSTIKRAIYSGKIREGVDCKKFDRSWVFVKANMDKIYKFEE